MDQVADEDLIRAYVAMGDVDALNVLVQRHIAMVRGVILGLVLNEADADDLTQEVFVKAIRALPGLRCRTSFQAWVYRIAVNMVTSHFRRRAASRTEPRAEPPEKSDPSPLPSEALMATEQTRRLAAAIERLSPCLRRAFILVGVQGLAIREAAAMEGCLAASMYRRLHVARRRLAQWLDEGKTA